MQFPEENEYYEESDVYGVKKKYSFCFFNFSLKTFKNTTKTMKFNLQSFFFFRDLIVRTGYPPEYFKKGKPEFLMKSFCVWDEYNFRAPIYNNIAHKIFIFQFLSKILSKFSFLTKFWSKIHCKFKFSMKFSQKL